MYAFRHVDAKNYGAHHLDFVIGDVEYLDYTLDTSDHLDTKTYEARHLDFIISLDYALYVFHHLETKAYRADHLDFVVGHRKHLDPALNTFRRVDTSCIYPLFSTVSEVNSACPLPCIYLFSLPNKNGFGQLAEIDLRRLLALAKQKSFRSR